jgi:hypothetical protein
VSVAVDAGAVGGAVGGAGTPLSAPVAGAGDGMAISGFGFVGVPGVGAGGVLGEVTPVEEPVTGPAPLPEPDSGTVGGIFKGEVVVGMTSKVVNSSLPESLPLTVGAVCVDVWPVVVATVAGGDAWDGFVGAGVVDVCGVGVLGLCVTVAVWDLAAGMWDVMPTRLLGGKRSSRASSRGRNGRPNAFGAAACRAARRAVLRRAQSRRNDRTDMVRASATKTNV